jgi:hypothetical protein
MTTPRHQITEHNAAAMLKAFGKQVNEGRVFTVDELQPILAYAAVLVARHQDEIEVMAREITDLKHAAHTASPTSAAALHGSASAPAPAPIPMPRPATVPLKPQ